MTNDIQNERELYEAARKAFMPALNGAGEANKFWASCGFVHGWTARTQTPPVSCNMRGMSNKQWAKTVADQYPAWLEEQAIKTPPISAVMGEAPYADDIYNLIDRTEKAIAKNSEGVKTFDGCIVSGDYYTVFREFIYQYRNLSAATAKPGLVGDEWIDGLMNEHDMNVPGNLLAAPNGFGLHKEAIRAALNKMLPYIAINEAGYRKKIAELEAALTKPSPSGTAGEVV